jgi:hypothetical protein
MWQKYADLKKITFQAENPVEEMDFPTRKRND